MQSYDTTTRSTRNNTNLNNNNNHSTSNSKKFVSPALSTSAPNKKKPPEKKKVNEVIDLLDSGDEGEQKDNGVQALMDMHGRRNDRDALNKTKDRIPLLKVHASHVYLGKLSFHSSMRNLRMDVHGEKLVLHLEDTTPEEVREGAAVEEGAESDSAMEVEVVESAPSAKSVGDLKEYAVQEIIPLEYIETITYGVIGRKEEKPESQPTPEIQTKLDVKIYGKKTGRPVAGATTLGSQCTCTDSDPAFIAFVLTPQCAEKQILKSVCVGSGCVLDPSITMTAAKTNHSKFITLVASQSEVKTFVSYLSKNLVMEDKVAVTTKKYLSSQFLPVFLPATQSAAVHTNRDDYPRSVMLQQVAEDFAIVDKRNKRRMRANTNSFLIA
eukprot:gene22186-28296_t